MNISVRPHQVLFGEHDLLEIRESKHFLACFEKPSRLRKIPMHPSGVRIAMVWDNLGLVAYEDQPEQLMSHLHIAFSPKDTPEQPSHASKSVIQINGGIVTAETTEGTLPRRGEIPIEANFGEFFSYTGDGYGISFTFERQASPKDRNLVGSLQSFSFSWR